MPKKMTLERARRDEREGKAPTTQAGEFVREEIEQIRRGKHGARSASQAIAIALSKARRAGVRLPTPKPADASEKTRRSAMNALKAGAQPGHKASPTRSRAVTAALRREGQAAVSKLALARHARTSAKKRSAADRSAAARKAARTRALHKAGA